jgi:hypothetical protein
MKPGPGRVFASLSITLLTMQLAMMANATAQELQPDKVRWQKLTHSASKFFISMRSEVHFDRVSAESTQSELLPVPTGDAKEPGSSDVMKVSLKSNLFGRDSEIKLWLMPDASVLQRTSLSTGKRDRYRTMRYTPQGAYSTRHFPLDDVEESKTYDQWTSTRERRYTIPEAERALPIGAAEGLFYVLASSDLNVAGDSLTTYMFDEEGTVRVELEAIETVKLRVGFVETSETGQDRVKGKLDVLRIHVNATRFGDQDGDAEFEFLGCKEDIDFFFDPIRRVIVQITGKVDHVGKVKIRLKELEYSLENTRAQETEFIKEPS